METSIYDQFEDYLQGNMSVEHKIDFESRLKNDAQFKQNFEDYELTSSMLQNHYAEETNDLKKTLEVMGKKHIKPEEKKSKIIRFNTKFFAIAAMFLVVFSVYIFTDNTSTNYADYNQHPEAAFVERSNNQADVLKAQQVFNNKDYKQAIEVFEKLDLSNNNDMQLYYGIALIETNQFEKAENVLLKISKNALFEDEAFWYLGLSKLKQKDYQSSKVYFEKISEDFRAYKKVKKLIKAL